MPDFLLNHFVSHPLSASYGSLARFRDIERLHPVGDHTIVGASGDISDFQYLKHILENVM
jgi:20S proteasome subunit beta 7